MLCTEQPDSIPNSELVLVMCCADQIIISKCCIRQVQREQSCVHLINHREMTHVLSRLAELPYEATELYGKYMKPFCNRQWKS